MDRSRKGFHFSGGPTESTTPIHVKMISQREWRIVILASLMRVDENVEIGAQGHAKGERDLDRQKD